MRVKHWAGYGTVDAKKINSTTVEVQGNHERGLYPQYFDSSDWHRWLGKRFHMTEPYTVKATEWWSDKDNSDHMRVEFVKTDDNYSVW